MEKNNITFLAVAALGIAFGFWAFMVFLSRGKNAKAIARKMKFGALLLTLNAAVTCTPQQPTCYEQAAMDHFYFPEYNTDVINLKLSENDTISGVLVNPSKEDYYYMLVNEKGEYVAHNKINISKIDSLQNSNFVIPLPQDTGAYRLYISLEAEKDSSLYYYDFNLNIH